MIFAQLTLGASLDRVRAELIDPLDLEQASKRGLGCVLDVPAVARREHLAAL